MGYCTQTQIERQIGPADLVTLADHDGDKVADAAVVAQAIKHATGRIDSYLQAKYVVPLTAPYPDEVVAICIDLAVCRMATGRRGLPEAWKEYCDRALAELEKIASGKKQIGATPKPAESAGAPGTLYSVQDRHMERDRFL